MTLGELGCKLVSRIAYLRDGFRDGDSHDKKGSGCEQTA